MEQFPMDIQFLNIQMKVGKRTKFVTVQPSWFKQLLEEEDALKGWTCHELITCTILDPSKKAWTMLPPWIDYRSNENVYCSLIRLRVERKTYSYIIYNVIPLSI